MGRYFSFSGRAQRTEFWLVNLAAAVLMLTLFVAGGGMVFASIQSAQSGWGTMAGLVGPGLIMFAGIIALSWVAYAVGARRLHDRGKSAWWLVAFFGPGILVWLSIIMSAGSGQNMGSTAGVLSMLSTVMMIWYYIEMGFLPGIDGPNQYDADPNTRYTAELDDASSWADRPIEELAAAARQADAEPRVLRKRKPAVQRAGGSPGFGRRGIAT